MKKCFFLFVFFTVFFSGTLYSQQAVFRPDPNRRSTGEMDLRLLTSGQQIKVVCVGESCQECPPVAGCEHTSPPRVGRYRLKVFDDVPDQTTLVVNLRYGAKAGDEFVVFPSVYIPPKDPELALAFDGNPPVWKKGESGRWNETVFWSALSNIDLKSSEKLLCSRENQ